MNDTAWVEWITSLVEGMPRQAKTAAFPPNRFYCLLDEPMIHLVRQSLRRSLHEQADTDEPLHVNPKCIIAPAAEIPEELVQQKEVLAGFALQGTIAWVRDEMTQSLLPFWLVNEIAGVLRHMQRDAAASPLIFGQIRSLLCSSGILVSESSLKARRQERERAVSRAAESFRAKGYAPISDLIHPFHVAALRRYYRYLLRSGEIYLGDQQSSRRYVAHNEPVAGFFHRQIAATLSAIAGEPLKPSYVYMASYLSGAELKKHTDREQCEFSVTLCLDFAPEPELATPWPIRLDTPSGTVTVYQAIGDGLAYRGTKLPHYRGVLGEEQTSTSIFFHYVAEDFSGSLN